MKLKVELRNITGKKVKYLRQEWKVPAVIYGKELKTPLTIVCDKNEFVRLYKKTGSSVPFTLEWDKIDQLVLVHDYQLDPLLDVVTHIDFLAIKKWEKVVTEVSIVLTGEAPVEKLGEWNIQLVKHEIEIEALPKDLPKEILLDISEIKDKNDVIFAKDLVLPKGVVIKWDLDAPILTVSSISWEDIEEESESEENAAGSANEPKDETASEEAKD